jgi:hypothetical protein
MGEANVIMRVLTSGKRRQEKVEEGVREVIDRKRYVTTKARPE